jgi:pimeloyl-ACP methyl ester carboxylesterase
MARLARWLGPWTPESRRPAGVRRRRLRIGGARPFDAWVYRPRGRPRGALLVVPGLHYLGPADSRLDRFLAILAEAGLLVLCPFLPEFRRLRVGPSLVRDAAAAFDALEALPEKPPVRPGVFSISFGSYPALELAAAAGRDRVGALTVFGGYASFEDAIRFSLEGDPAQPHDPLNRPVVFLNLIEHLPGRPRDPSALRDAWITYVRRTWGRPEMKRRARWEPLARAMARGLPPDARGLFLRGTGAEPGGVELAARALRTARAELAHLDPRPACARIRCPVTIVHGRDDDVIPHTHARMLAEAIPDHVPTRVLLTGLYAHTGHGAPSPRELADEARTLGRILAAIVDGATAPAR